jgi:hypothetical protein
MLWSGPISQAVRAWSWLDAREEEGSLTTSDGPDRDELIPDCQIRAYISRVPTVVARPLDGGQRHEKGSSAYRLAAKAKNGSRGVLAIYRMIPRDA